jgi:hypothetical protein
MKRKDFIDRLRIRSLEAAVRSRGLAPLCARLSRIVPDISTQYTGFRLDAAHLLVKVRALHAFQVSLAARALRLLGTDGRRTVIVVDIGDSSGTHIRYLQALFPQVEGWSVNLDREAVARIRNQGLRAIQARAEDLSSYPVDVDILTCFQMLEHLPCPVDFLKTLSDRSSCRLFVVTVPYLRRSRVGLHHLRRPSKEEVTAENTHVFELCPTDWALLFRHTGWSIVHEDIFRQYPHTGPLRLMQIFWAGRDFEGFYGVLLERDQTYSRLYRDW